MTIPKSLGREFDNRDPSDVERWEQAVTEARQAQAHAIHLSRRLHRLTLYRVHCALKDIEGDLAIAREEGLLDVCKAFGVALELRIEALDEGPPHD